MASISCAVVTVVFLLVLADTRGSSVQDIQTDARRDSALLASMRGFREALQSLSATVTEGQQLIQQQIKDALAFQAKEQKNQQKEIIDAMKKEFAAFLKVDELNQEIQDMKIKIADSNETVVTLNQEIQGLKKELAESNKTILRLQEILDNKTNEIGALSLKVEAQKKAGCVEPDHPQNITEVVQAYSRNMDWGDLRRGLEPMLNRSSEEYGQLRAGSLYWVGHNGHTELIHLLLRAGLPVNAVDSSGDTMLHGAADNCRLPLVQLLADNRANVNATNNYGTTPLMFAAECGNLAVVRKLVEFGADTAAKGYKNSTALSSASGHPKVVEYLKQLPH